MANILKHNDIYLLDNGMVVILQDKVSKQGWNCAVLGCRQEHVLSYAKTEILVFDEDLKHAHKCSGFEFHTINQTKSYEDGIYWVG